MQGGKEGGREGGRENEYIQRLYNEIPITECLITHTDTDTPHTHRHRHTTHTHTHTHEATWSPGVSMEENSCSAEGGDKWESLKLHRRLRACAKKKRVRTLTNTHVFGFQVWAKGGYGMD